MIREKNGRFKKVKPKKKALKLKAKKAVNSKKFGKVVCMTVEAVKKLVHQEVYIQLLKAESKKSNSKINTKNKLVW